MTEKLVIILTSLVLLATPALAQAICVCGIKRGN